MIADRGRYLREDELLHDLARMLRQGKGRPAVYEEIPDLLRAGKITITCNRTQRTLNRDSRSEPLSPMG